MSILVDYILARECKNNDAMSTCHKCGKCGRVFNESGIMIDDGGTEIDDEE